MSEAVEAAFNKKKVGALYVITNFLCGHSFQALECTPQYLPLGGVPLRPEREEWHRPAQLPPLPRLHGSLVRGEEVPQTFSCWLHIIIVAVVDPSDLRDARDADPPVPHEPCQHRLQLLPLPLPGGEEEKQHRFSN